MKSHTGLEDHHNFHYS